MVRHKLDGDERNMRKICIHGEEIAMYSFPQTIPNRCRCCGVDLLYENIMTDSDDLFCLKCKPDLESMKPITDKIQ